MTPRLVTKQRLANIWQFKDDRAYIDIVDKRIIDGEPLGDEAKVLGVVRGLKTNTKLCEMTNTQYPVAYANFRQQAGNLSATLSWSINSWKNTVLVMQIKRNENWESRTRNRLQSAGTFKPFNNRGVEVKLLEILSISPAQVSSTIRGRNLLPQPRKIERERRKN